MLSIAPRKITANVLSVKRNIFMRKNTVNVPIHKLEEKVKGGFKL